MHQDDNFQSEYDWGWEDEVINSQALAGLVLPHRVMGIQ